jgi:type IV secretory pathway protease TraF
MLGDNREKSTDSRYFGCIKKDRLISKTVLVFYPFNRAKWLYKLPNYSS